MKLMLKLAILLLLALIGLAVAGLYYANVLVTRGIEKGATYALGVDTTLDSAKVGLFSGEFSMSGLHVDNPDGYDAPHFMELADGGVAVSFASLRDEVVELPTLTLTGLDMHLIKSGGAANYDLILENLKRFESKDPEPLKKFVIRTVKIEDVNVHVNLVPQGGALTQVNVPIDLIELKDVGTGGESVSMASLVDIILKAVLGAAVDKAGGIIPSDVLGDLQGRLAGLESLSDLGIDLDSTLGKDAADLLKGLGGGDVDGSLKDAADGLKNLGGGLGGLLGGDDDDDDDE